MTKTEAFRQESKRQEHKNQTELALESIQQLLNNLTTDLNKRLDHLEYKIEVVNRKAGIIAKELTNYIADT